MGESSLSRLEDFLSTRSLSHSTEKIYRQAVDSWDKITQTPLEETTRTSLQKWYREIQKTSKSGTILKYAANLRSLYAYIQLEDGHGKRQAKTMAQEMFDAIPFRDLSTRQKKEQELKDKLVTHEEFTKLLNGTSSPSTRALIALTYESGCRKGEILGIKLKDITRRENHWVIIVSGKTGERAVPIVSSIPYIKAWIQQHPDRHNENQYLFVAARSKNIERMKPTTFNSILHALCDKLKLRRLHPHQLRHTRLTYLAEEGLGEYQMKSFAGWTPDSNMASKYIHLTGTSHVNAVLETQGINGENGDVVKPEPFLKLVECPNCGKDVDEEMMVCPFCQFILDDSLGISQDERITKLEAEIKQLKRQQAELFQALKALVG